MIRYESLSYERESESSGLIAFFNRPPVVITLSLIIYKVALLINGPEQRTERQYEP